MLATFDLGYEAFLERYLELQTEAITGEDFEDVISEDELQEHLLERFPKWWLPDQIVFIKSIPKTTTGKFNKKVLCEEFKSEHRALPADE